MDAAIQLWLHESREAAMPVAQLQRVLEKSIALGIATRDPSATHNQALTDLIANYALQLVNQGCLASALKYLVIPDSAPADAAPTLAVLKERVYKAAVPEQVRIGFNCTVDHLHRMWRSLCADDDMQGHAKLLVGMLVWSIGAARKKLRLSWSR